MINSDNTSYKYRYKHKDYYTNVKYFNKNTRRKEDIKEIFKKSLKYITRADDSTKKLQDKTIVLLSNLLRMLDRSKGNSIFITHDFISEYTNATKRHNQRILKQLADIFNFKYSSKNFKRGYIVKYTIDGLNRIRNVEKYYQVTTRKRIVKTVKNKVENQPNDSTKSSVSCDSLVNKNVEHNIYNKELELINPCLLILILHY